MEKKWFKAKKYGWGWYPATKEGWLVMLAYIIVFVVAEIIYFKLIMSYRELWISIPYFGFVILMTLILIKICYIKGEKPGWRWGGKKWGESK